MSRSNCRFLNTETSRGRSAGWKKAQPADRPRDVCILICEELLDHLLKSGYRKIGVTVKGRKMRVIDLDFLLIILIILTRMMRMIRI